MAQLVDDETFADGARFFLAIPWIRWWQCRVKTGRELLCERDVPFRQGASRAGSTAWNKGLSWHEVISDGEREWEGRYRGFQPGRSCERPSLDSRRSSDANPEVARDDRSSVGRLRFHTAYILAIGSGMGVARPVARFTIVYSQ